MVQQEQSSKLDIHTRFMYMKEEDGHKTLIHVAKCACVARVELYKARRMYKHWSDSRWKQTLVRFLCRKKKARVLVGSGK
jgi:hypothetical protein